MAVSVAHAEVAPRLPESLIGALPGVGDLVVYPRSGEVHVCRRIPPRAPACTSARQVIDGALANHDAWLTRTADLLYPNDPDIAVLDRAIALAPDRADGLFLVAYRLARHRVAGVGSRSRTLVVTRCAPIRDSDVGSEPTALCSEAEYPVEPSDDAQTTDAHARDGTGRLAVATTAHGVAILLPDVGALFTADAVDPLAWGAAHIRRHTQPVFEPASATATEQASEAHTAVFGLHAAERGDALIVTREARLVARGARLVSHGMLNPDPWASDPMIRVEEIVLFDPNEKRTP
ncbi:hypothetical protein [Thiocapsa bogorovii]|uniref:hypothetical protein n=1 Tax=Thiocapsa bogorovii TaxID=521689 RepID=UPI001E3A39BE|nr:hypothetical protein [Thiocapsa bogorovii]UHD16326.1 hypothetical protein LT988_24295 [Thiocapsa bogorovii]